MKKISSQTIYTGPLFTLTHDEIKIHEKHFPRDVVHHHGGVAILVYNQKKVLLVNQYRYAVAENTWEIPAGKLEKDEDPYACGIRELEEESGLGCSSMNLLYEMYSTPGFCSEKIYIYEAVGLYSIRNPKPMDEDEEIISQWFTLEEIKSMLKQKQIKDAKTMIALQYLLLKQDL